MRRWRNLADARGTTTVEFALLAALLFAVVFGIIDMSRALWEWNAAAKATQVGARFAATISPVALNFREFSGLSLGLRTGSKIPAGAPGTAPVLCDESGCGGDPARMDGSAFAAVVAHVRRVHSRITAGNLTIEYRHVGHGIAGNPLGPDLKPAVTVRLRALAFRFITPGLAGVVSIPMPDFAATLVGEDGAAT